MNRFRIPFRLLAASLLAAGFVFLPSAAARGSSFEREARRTAAAYFASMNAKSFYDTCALLSKRFYRVHHLRDQTVCALTLRIGFAWEQPYRFQIVGVEIDGERAIVRALADGVPGWLVLVREAGRYKILEVQGA
jgi:hypothetical protein